jgi:hypothetical protein
MAVKTGLVKNMVSIKQTNPTTPAVFVTALSSVFLVTTFLGASDDRVFDILAAEGVLERAIGILLARIVVMHG